MNLSEFAEKFREQYIEGKELILKETDPFREIDSYDSLTGMALLVMIKDEFDMDISEEEWKRLKTIEEVYHYINPQLQ